VLMDLETAAARGRCALYAPAIWRRPAISLLLIVLCGSAEGGSPWLEPGDVGLRQDIALLTDEDLISVPMTFWPMSWPQVAREVARVDPARVTRDDVQAALRRVRARAAREGRTGWTSEARIAAAGHPTPLRTFAETPREEGEIGGALSWLGDRFAVRLEGTAVADPDDDKTFRPDGSYLGLTLGNWMLSAGYLQRWWGPGWEGSNILGNNARPVPTLAIDRKYSDPFETKWLSWLGPWSLNAFYGILENDREDIDRPHFLGLRITVKPFDALEIGLMRTAQWCGEGRNCDWETFENLITGNDNPGETVDPEFEPGNQMAGYDVRWASPFGTGPWAIYYHDIGEDESGRRPIFRLTQFGVETWGQTGSGLAWRAHAERASTNPDCAEGSTGCAYRGGPHNVEGYSYYGRSLGHAMFYNGEMISGGLALTTPAGDRISGIVRWIDLNQRESGRFHTVVDQNEERWNLELAYETERVIGTLRVGVGADRGERADGSTYLAGRGFLELEHRFGR